MLQANDLRIGNWIFSCEEYIQVAGVENNKVYHKHGWCLLGEDCPCGIELTAEILERAGFEQDKYPPAPVWSDGEMIIFKSNTDLINGFHTGYWKYQVEIRYVHQLQNLYFALTGKELVIEL